MKIGRACDARRLDEAAMQDYGIASALLMENAAIAARDVIQSRWGIASKRVLVICGCGNNGGDGFALARHLYSCGAMLTILLAGDEDKISGDARANYQSARRLPLELLDLNSMPDNSPEIHFNRFDIIVDALFGTGLSRNIEGQMEALINTINDAKVPVLSLDIPSGINSDSGEVLGCALKAEATVSFGILKRGNLLYPGHRLGGQLYFSGISFPPELYEDEHLKCKVNLPQHLPERSPSGHKGSFGKILIIGGCPEYRGAPALVAQGALRGGAGYARLAVPADISPEVFCQVPEAVFLTMEGGSYLGMQHLPDVVEYSGNHDITVLGCGLSCSPDSLKMARQFIADSKGPLLIDGDALTALAGRENLTKKRDAPLIITPHTGEMARLTGYSIAEVESHRVEVAMEAAKRYAAITVLKGAHSIIADTEGRAWINLSGNSCMATAGSGDILAGLTAALALGRLDIAEAVCLAVYLHGLAGDLAAETMGEYAVLARDLLEFIPQAIKFFPERIKSNPYSGKIIRL